METLQNNGATFESVWAAFLESDRQRKENERILNEKFAETYKQMRETDKQMRETDKQMRETDRILQKTIRTVERNSELIGNIGNNQGFFAEEYFFNSFENGKQNFFGEHFDEIEKNLKPKKKRNVEDEYDIVMTNGRSVAIVEVKYKANKNDIPDVLKKAETFRILCPDYKDYKIYLGLASMSFYPELEEECKKQGIAIIKQVGDKVVIYDENLKSF